MIGSPGQEDAGLAPIAVNYGPLVVKLAVSLQRHKRQKCAGCGHRRVTFGVGLGDLYTSPLLCAKCAGIR